MISATSSIPTDIRMRPSVIPASRRRWRGTWACVIDAECWIRVATSPNETASEHRWRLSARRLPSPHPRRRRRRASRQTPTFAEGRAHAAGGPASRGSARRAPSDGYPETRPPTGRLYCDASILTANVRISRKTSHAATGLTTLPNSLFVCHRARSAISRPPTMIPATRSAWPPRYLVALWTTMSTPSGRGR
jgi:hypothetical protein